MALDLGFRSCRPLLEKVGKATNKLEDALMEMEVVMATDKALTMKHAQGMQKLEELRKDVMTAKMDKIKANQLLKDISLQKLVAPAA